MTFLLDVNVLIALIDTRHIWHENAHRWFEQQGMQDWATCPLTENGLARIVGHPAYPNSLGTPGAVAELMREFCGVGHHTFWPDRISLLDPSLVIAERLGTSKQITDTYLLALAVCQNGTLVTFDRRLSHLAVKGGAAALLVIA